MASNNGESKAIVEEESSVVTSKEQGIELYTQPTVEVQICHCPCTGRIGDLEFTNIPCMLSRPDEEKTATTKIANKRRKLSTIQNKPSRKTTFTVEAISLDTTDTPYGQMTWIGINQSRANRFIESFLLDGHLNALLDKKNDTKWRPTTVQREYTIAKSKIDFLVDQQIYIEVKTPLIHLPCQHHPNYRENRLPLKAFDRIVKHFDELTHVLNTNTKSSARLLLCFMYNAPPFKRPQATPAINLLLKLHKKRLKQA
ncbi:hypothetical protein BDF19DRAFT_436527 [Syncephalis fuscata]|nr:hypothetical protein BDF19DRAFT_436527 [Syncephalis fuscata]